VGGEIVICCLKAEVFFRLLACVLRDQKANSALDRVDQQGSEFSRWLQEQAKG
jgi:hypothetical protein